MHRAPSIPASEKIRFKIADWAHECWDRNAPVIKISEWVSRHGRLPTPEEFPTFLKTTGIDADV